MKNGNKLTAQERAVIIEKGTENPFSGEYWDYHEEGTYRCRQCGAPLYSSDSKFDSGCGWPSYDEAADGAVREIPDADSLRTEIVCAKCGGHLGHVFRGEEFTSKDTRHCVNSISLTFEPAGEHQGLAYFAGATFWPAEEYHQDYYVKIGKTPYCHVRVKRFSE